MDPPLPRAVPWPRRLRNVAIVVAGLIAAFAAIGFLVVPPLARAKIETMATEALGRSATLREVRFNPFTLRATLSDFAVADREPGRTLFAFETLILDLSSASFWRRAPVFDAVDVVRPKIALVRQADGAYNIQDLIDQVLARPPGPTPLFSVNNIEIRDGSFSLDDRPHHHMLSLTGLQIGIPFLSSLPYEAQIRVTPKFEGAVDGTRFALAGNTSTPFADTQEATLDLDVDAIPLSRYVGYLQLPHRLKLVDATLTSRLKLAFVTEKGSPRTLTVSGSAQLDRVAIARADGSPMLAAKKVDIALSRLEPLARSIAVDRIAVDGPDLDLRRDSDGVIELERLAAAEGAPAGASSSPPWTFRVADARIEHGTLRIADATTVPPFTTVLSGVEVRAKQLASKGGPASIDVAFEGEEGAQFDGQGEMDVAGRAAHGHFAFTRFRLAKLFPYYASALNLDVRRGTFDCTGDFRVDAAASPLQFELTGAGAALNDLELAVRGERDPLWRVPRVDLTGITFDLAKRSVTIERSESRQAAFRLVREADGTIDFERLVRKADVAANAASGAQAGAAEPAFQVRVNTLLLDRIAADVEDRVPKPAVKLRLTDARLAAESVSNVPGVKGKIEFSSRVGAKGRLRFNGALVTNPFAGDWRIEATALDLMPLRPYFESRTNVIVTGGALGAKGRVVMATDPPRGARATYAGDVTISDFGSLDRPTSQELLRWKTLSLIGVDVASSPPRLALGALSLDQFYARLIVNPDATLNLQRLLAPAAAEESAAAQKAPVAAASAPPVASSTDASASDRELPVSIGRIALSAGEVQFSDFFIQPNYSAHLTDVNGTISALSSTQDGDVDLSARVETTAPVEVRGTVNPFARQLTLDLTASAKDVDLPPLTPYSVKYAGYGIQKGTLSMDVHYRIDNRKLSATNKLVLNQLTFGAKVESPTATRLPVLLAVSLLKDRNGVIHLDLPIEGTLDDPKFSVWGVIVQIIVNLVTKAATAPFALLGALAGGGGEQLAYVEFAPGHADLSAPAKTKLESLAKALADRPALKVDATGRAIPDVDREGLKRVALDNAMRTQKQKALVAQGETASQIEAMTIAPEEYPKYLAAVYKATDFAEKPKNVIGMAKDLPPAEMESLLLATYAADDEALRVLANRRAIAVKEWFVGTGGVATDRVFVIAAKMNADGISDRGAPTRVDFSLR